MTEQGQFVFDKFTHTYWLGNRQLVGVSEAIKAAGIERDFSRVKPDVLENARKLGTYVHAACQYLDEGDLNWETVSPDIEPYVRAWEKFKKDKLGESKWLGIEKPLYHATLGFAGTPDRIVQGVGFYSVIDIKTYQPDDITALQLAGYSFLRFGPQPGLYGPKRWGLCLKDNGLYSLEEYTDGGDESVFLSCLTIAKWKRSNK